jgi:membrane protein YdbS with pleckstrin-like domain
MRTRLNIQYSLGFKIISTVLLLIILYIISTSLLSLYNWPEWLFHFYQCFLIVASYLIVQIVFKDRTSITFDHENLYITKLVTGEEKIIPLGRITWMKLTLGRIGTYMRDYRKFRLRYEDSFYDKQELSLYIWSLGKEFKEFQTLVLRKNPNFIYENYSW